MVSVKGRAPQSGGSNRVAVPSYLRSDLICPVDDLGIAEEDDTNHDDLAGIGIEGLEWLVNAPKVDGVVIGEDGIPLRFWSVDPRAFALHKLWLSARSDREPVKRARDRAQALAAARIAMRYLGMKVSDPALLALPEFMRQLADGLERASLEGTT